MSEEPQLPQPRVVDADKMRMMLRRKFPADQYAMLYEVRDAAGFSARRNADVIVVGLWPSRGCAVEGMEIKVSRSDWLRELKKPEKAEAFVRFCDHWWVIAADQSIVRVEELPKTWGLMVPRGNGLGVVKQAPDLKPDPVDRFFLAAMMKRAVDTAADSPEVRARIEVRLAESAREIDDRITRATASLKHDYEQLRKSVDAFEEASGVKIDGWRGGKIGVAVKAVLAGEHTWRLQELGRMKKTAQELVDWLVEHVPDAVSDEETAG